MKLGGRGNRVPRKVFKCQYCKEDFTVSYIGENSKKIVKTCSDCISLVKRDAAIIKNNGLVDNEELIERAILTVSKIGYPITLVELLGHLGCSSKTLSKAFKDKGTSYAEILDSLNMKSNGISKFQYSVLNIVRELFPDEEVLSEETFDGLINPITGNSLRVDIYIPKFNLIIECDGDQHNDENHYFNIMTLKNGRTPSYVTDQIKNNYCERNKIKLIRIPYTKNVSKTSIEELLNESL